MLKLIALVLTLPLLAGCGRDSAARMRVQPAGEVTPGVFAMRLVTIAGKSYPYGLFVPRAYTPTRSWPVVAFMHGGRERGSDGARVLSTCFGKAVEAQRDTFPAIAVLPQLPRSEGMDRKLLRDIVTTALDSVARAFNVDAKRVYLTGYSFGGGLAIEIAYDDPARFAALGAVSTMIVASGITGAFNATTGSADSLVAARLGSMPIWAFHGTADSMVTVDISRKTADIFRAAGAKSFTYTEVPGGSHTCAAEYNDGALFKWMWAQHR